MDMSHSYAHMFSGFLQTVLPAVKNVQKKRKVMMDKKTTVMSG